VRRDVEAGSLLTAEQYGRAQRVRAVFIREIRPLYDLVDAFVVPGRPAPAGVETPTAMRFDRQYTVNGFPWLSVPMGFSSDPAGLPMGLGITAAPFGEELLYAIGAAYQSATDWHTRVPSL
jgi:aspartyl-tRNA(Asn)/glutamyl-tRNA(Gln) amidotransferase subunit A